MVSIRTIFLSFQMINCVGRYIGYTLFLEASKMFLSSTYVCLQHGLFQPYFMLTICLAK